MTGGPTNVNSPTLLDEIQASFKASLRSPDGVAAPSALLWTDGDGQWASLVPALQERLPQLYILGPYASQERSGPVIFLRCVVARTLPDVSPSDGVVPILYLPRIARQELRAAADCPPALQPLIELQYSGAVWHQRNGRDWTVEAFLTSDDALGLDIARDNRTREAMLRALPLLATEPIANLGGRRLEAEDFDRLAIGDPVRDLLNWLSDPEAFTAHSDASRLATFRDVCIHEFHFDPEKDGVQVAADALLNGGEKWDEAWQRFCEAPRAYPGIAKALRDARPRDLLGDQSRFPGANERQEDALRRELEAAVDIPHVQACERVIELEKKHKERRSWVWSALGESPYAVALEPLSRLAAAAQMLPAAASAGEMAADYAGGGWACDYAAMGAVGTLKSGAQAALIEKLVRALYWPWLDRSARRFQELLSAQGIDPAKLATPVKAERDTCILFADGLRFDVGAVLQQRLEAQRYRVRMSHRIAPIPTVTATAKPVASPAYSACVGKNDAADFAPVMTASSQVANATRLKEAMTRAGIEVLESDQTSMLTGGEGGGWTEAGKLDSLGHAIGIGLANQIETQIDLLQDRIVALLNSGWSRVRVVTDHGWLLLPGGLPKVELSPHLVATKWARCAAVKGESMVQLPTFPWYWNPLLRVASPPGIGSFFAGTEYAHGGISLQECVIPELIVERGEEAIRATISELTWRGMRCRVAVETNTTGLMIDLRLTAKQAGSSIAASVKELAASGDVSITVADDKHEGASACIVVLDPSGRVLDYRPTMVGEGV
ncbi:MAG: BREX-1 system phosphatase PglZ type B [Rhodospirillum sp.]|nr:BREX-1 system phosphatase PglZ type B [Rhodospirillum sp.]